MAFRILECARRPRPDPSMTLKGPEHWIRGIAGLAIVSGSRLVTRSDHKGLWLWDLDNVQQVGKPSLGHDDPMATGS